MADFSPLLRRAIAGLEKNTAENRRVLYDRARAALVAQLRGVTPPLAEADITRERLGLEEAIRKIEAEFARGQRPEAPTPTTRPPLPPGIAKPASPAPTATPGEAAPPSPVRTPPAAPPARTAPFAPPRPPPPSDEAAAPSARGAGAFQSRMERVVGGGKQMMRDAAKETPGLGDPARFANKLRETAPDSALELRRRMPAPPRDSAAPGGEAETPPSPRSPPSPPALPPIDDPGLDFRAPPRAAARPEWSDIADDHFEAPFEEPAPTAEQPEAEPRPQTGSRSRMRRQRYEVEVAEPKPRRGKFWLILGLLLVIAVGAAGVGLYAASGKLHLFDTSEDVKRPDEKPQERPKSADRVTPATPTRTPSAQPQERAAGTPPPAQALQVAQRVILYEEDPASPQESQVLIGSVTWRTATVSPGGNAPPEVSVVAEVQVPDRRLSATITIKRNVDRALPASHIIELKFATPPDFIYGGVARVPGVLAKRVEGQRGVALLGLAVDVTPGYFIVGLSSVESDLSRNIQLLKDSAWIDVPLFYKNGRRAIMSIEKGLPGERVFGDAFAAWNQ